MCLGSRGNAVKGCVKRCTSNGGIRSPDKRLNIGGARAFVIRIGTEDARRCLQG